MLVLVMYDIPHNKRRTQLATFLEGYGQRVQRSVSECYLSLGEIAGAISAGGEAGTGG